MGASGERDDRDLESDLRPGPIAGSEGDLVVVGERGTILRGR